LRFFVNARTVPLFSAIYRRYWLAIAYSLTFPSFISFRFLSISEILC
jgi:hypothetical protein